MTVLRRTATGICIIRATLGTLRVFENALRSHSLLAPYSAVQHRFDAAQLTNGKNGVTGFNLSKGNSCTIAAGGGILCFLFFRPSFLPSFRLCHAHICNFQRSRALSTVCTVFLSFSVSGLLACVYRVCRIQYTMAWHCIVYLLSLLHYNVPV